MSLTKPVAGRLHREPGFINSFDSTVLDSLRGSAATFEAFNRESRSSDARRHQPGKLGPHDRRIDAVRRLAAFATSIDRYECHI